MMHNLRVCPDVKVICFSHFCTTMLTDLSLSFSSTTLYDFKAVSGLFHSKSNCMGQDITRAAVS